MTTPVIKPTIKFEFAQDFKRFDVDFAIDWTDRVLREAVNRLPQWVETLYTIDISLAIDELLRAEKANVAKHRFMNQFQPSDPYYLTDRSAFVDLRKSIINAQYRMDGRLEDARVVWLEQVFIASSTQAVEVNSQLSHLNAFGDVVDSPDRQKANLALNNLSAIGGLFESINQSWGVSVLRQAAALITEVKPIVYNGSNQTTADDTKLTWEITQL